MSYSVARVHGSVSEPPCIAAYTAFAVLGRNNTHRRRLLTIALHTAAMTGESGVRAVASLGS